MQPKIDRQEYNKMIVLKEKESQQDVELRQNITKLVWKMGISPKLKGYVYLREVLVLAVLHPEMTCNQLYKMVANKFGIRPRSVGSAIRYAIESAGDENPKLLHECFPYPITNPSNLDVISLIADKIRIWFC